MSADFVEIEIPVPYGYLRGKWWGSKEQQPILLIHGWQDNAGTFDLLVPLLLSKNLSFLCIDLPGHGLSSHIPKGNPYHLVTEGVVTIRRIKRYYGWNRLSLIGHSIGAVICFVYSATFPDEVDFVVSIDSIQPAIIAEDLANESAVSIDKYLDYDSLTENSLPEYQYSEAVKILMRQYNVTEMACNILLKRGLKKLDNGKFIFSRDVRLEALHFGLSTMLTASELAKNVQCRFLHIKAIPGHSFDKMQINHMIMNIVKKHAKEFKSVRVKGGHHVHLTEPENVHKTIFAFITK